jgi:hypothetical protein
VNTERSTSALDSRPLLQRKTVWCLIVVISLMAEYQLIYWTSDFGSDPDVVSHVGFAGTIVSTILALVAIGYAYFQTFSARRDADTIAAQINNLRNVLGTLDVASDEIKNQTDALKLVREEIVRVGTGQDAVIEAQRRIEAAIVASSTAKKSTAGEAAKAAAPSTVVVEPRKAAKMVVDSASEVELVVLVALAEVTKRKDSADKLDALLAATVKEQLADENNAASFIEAMVNYYEGFTTAYSWLLISLDCAEFAETGTSVRLTSDLLAMVDSKAAEFRKTKKSNTRLTLNMRAFDKISLSFWNDRES